MSYTHGFLWKDMKFIVLRDGRELFVYREGEKENILDWDEDFDSPYYGLITEMLMNYYPNDSKREV